MLGETKKIISVLMGNASCQEAELLICIFVNNTSD